MNSVVIRADASPTIGAGHQMRCLALAQAISEIGGQAIFSMAGSLPLVEKRLQDEAIQMMKITAKPGSAADAEATIAIANNYEAKWIVADGYYFGGPFQQRVKASGHNLLSIDDDASSRHYSSDIIVNQNISAPALDYSARETYTEMLLGTRYALLRRDFLHPPRSTCSSPPTATNILVTLGGGDAMGAIETVVDAILRSSLDDLHAIILLSASHPGLPTMLEKIVASPVTINFVEDTTRVADHMRWAHIAISAGGGTSWELSYFGIPTLLIVAAENQRSSVDELVARGAVAYLGSIEDITVASVLQELEKLCHDLPRRQHMARTLYDLVDGLGAHRVAVRLLGMRKDVADFPNSKLKETG